MTHKKILKKHEGMSLHAGNCRRSSDDWEQWQNKLFWQIVKLQLCCLFGYWFKCLPMVRNVFCQKLSKSQSISLWLSALLYLENAFIRWPGLLAKIGYLKYAAAKTFYSFFVLSPSLSFSRAGNGPGKFIVKNRSLLRPTYRKMFWPLLLHSEVEKSCPRMTLL